MDLFSVFLGAFIPLLVITDPFGMVAVFLSLTKDDDRAWQNKQALKCGIYVCILLLVFLAAGVWILQFFGITLNAVNLAGGLIVGKVGWNLMNPKDKRKITPREHAEGKAKKDVSFVPLTMPIVAGPGAITVIVTAASHIETSGGGWQRWVAVAVSILFVSVLTWICFRFSRHLLRIMGDGGLNALSRIMGFLLMCIAAQMIIIGFLGVIKDRFPQVEENKTAQVERVDHTTLQACSITQREAEEWESIGGWV